MTLCKRMVQFLPAPDTNFNLSDLIRPFYKDKFGGGFLKYFAAAYKCYGGSYIINVQPGIRTVITSVQEMGDTMTTASLASNSLKGSRCQPFSCINSLGGQVQMGYDSRYLFNIIPVDSATSGDELYNTGVACFEYDAVSLEGVRYPFSYCVADGFVLSNFYMVPSLLVDGKRFNHYIGAPFFIKPFINIVNDARAPHMKATFAEASLWANELPFIAGAVVGNPINRTAFKEIGQIRRIPTRNLSDSTLQTLGYNITPGQPRSYTTGTDTAYANMSNYVGAFGQGRISRDTTGPPSTTFGPGFRVQAAGTIQQGIIGVDSVVASKVWDYSNQIFADRPFLLLVGVAVDDTRIYLPDVTETGDLFCYYATIRATTSTPVFNFYPFTTQIQGFSEMMRGGAGVVLDPVKAVVSEPVTDHQTVGIGDMSMTSSVLVSREQIIGTYAWTVNDEVGSNILSLSLPLDTLVSPIISAAFNAFLFYSHENMDFTFSLQSNKFQAGSLVAFFVPLSTQSEAFRTHANLTSQLVLRDHMIMNAGSTKSFTLSIPWLYPKLAMNVRNQTVPLGQLVLSVLTPLRVGTEAVATSVNVTVSVSFKGAQFSVPLNVAGEPLLNTTQRNRIRARGPLNPPKDIKHFRGHAEGFFEVIGFKQLLTKAIDFGTNALGTIIKGALVDKPNLSIAPQNVGPISFPYGCAMEGMTYAEPQDAIMGLSLIHI